MASRTLLSKGVNVAAAIALIVAVLTSPIRHPRRAFLTSPLECLRRNFALPQPHTAPSPHVPVKARVVQIKALPSVSEERLSDGGRLDFYILDPGFSFTIIPVGIQFAPSLTGVIHPLRC